MQKDLPFDLAPSITPAIEKLAIESSHSRLHFAQLPTIGPNSIRACVRQHAMCFGPGRRCSIASWCKWTPAKPPNSPPTRWPWTAYSPSANSADRRTSAWRSTTWTRSACSRGKSRMQKAESRTQNRFCFCFKISPEAVGLLAKRRVRLSPTAYRLLCCFLSAFCLLRSAFALACPFCTAVKPTLTQQRESSAVAFLGECTAAGSSDKSAEYQFAVRKWFKGCQPRAEKKRFVCRSRTS